jgi:hypothetical protein
MTLENRSPRRDDVAPAHPVSGVNRRSVIMNTAVTVASLASAAAVAAPTIALDHPEREIVAILARLEHVLDLLRTRHICDGWKLDETDAERVLQFFRASLRYGQAHEDQPGHDDEWMFVISWARDHGISFDWLLCGDPDSMICRRVAQSRRGQAAAGAGADPIYAAIERHRAAYIAHDQSCTEETRLEETLPAEQTTWSATMRMPMPPEGCTDAPDWIAHQLLHNAAGTEECVSLCALVQTVPTTNAGTAALVSYIREHVEDGNELGTTFGGESNAAGEALFLDCDEALLATIEEAMTNLAA